MMRPRGSPEELEERRHRAISLVKRGVSTGEIARQIGVDRRSVQRWKAAYRASGPDALKARAAPGRPPKLSREAKDQLASALLGSPRAAGFEEDRWTHRKVTELIHSRFGIRYHVRYIGRLLRTIKSAPQSKT